MNAAPELSDPGGDPESEMPLQDWPLRPWLLALLLAVAGLVVHIATDGEGDNEALGAAIAAFAFFGGMAAAFTLDPERPGRALLFALAIGTIMSGIAWHVVEADGSHASTEYVFFAGVLFALLALPLFQAGFLRDRFGTDYGLSHFHVWADAVSGGAALAFTGLSWLLLMLLNELFKLVGIELLQELIRSGAFGWIFSGAAFGAALGVVRNNLRIVGAMQNVVMLVFALLAVPFAFGVIVFLIALLASGGQALWEATDSATPILLATAAGCFVLFNAIIRDNDDERSGNRLLQVTAAVLAAGIFPLAIFAAISMGIRIDQYGLVPERIWGLLAVMVATAYGLASWVALARGRLAGWSDALRSANLKLAAGVCVLAFVLALPLWDFGAMSARNQVARLESGKVEVEEFDFAALKFDFGEAGREVLDRLTKREGEIGKLAVEAQELTSRPYRYARQTEDTDFDLRVQPEDPQIRRWVLAHLRSRPYGCREFCVAIDLGEDDTGQRHVALVQGFGFQTIPVGPGAEDFERAREERPELKRDSKVEIREVTRPYIVIDGKPMDRPVDVTGSDLVGNVKYVTE